MVQSLKHHVKHPIWRYKFDTKKFYVINSTQYSKESEGVETSQGKNDS